MFGDASLTTPAQQQAIDGFLLQNPNPSATDIQSFLRLYSDADRPAISQMLVAHGVDPGSISMANTWLSSTSGFKSGATLWGILSIASAAASGYHGYRRNNSIGWGLAWFALGSIFPVITPTIAVAQGFSKRKAG